MKKIFLLIAGISLCTAGFSQFTYGPKLGVNTARFANDKIMPGFQIGGFLNGEFDDRIGIQTDFLLTLKGNLHEEETTVTAGFDSLGNPIFSKVQIKNTTYYRFVDIPICIYFPISKHIRGFVGPQLSVFRSGHEKEVVGSTTTETDLKGIKGKTSIAAGFDFTSNSPIIFGVRFVTNKFEGGTTDPTTGEAEVKRLNAVMLNLAYKMDW